MKLIAKLKIYTENYNKWNLEEVWMTILRDNCKNSRNINNINKNHNNKKEKIVKSNYKASKEKTLKVKY